ncbi:MAG TPA: alcohol dehydrogenase catalytic domain-containing protein [Terriglobia bacterium]|nr:alcohol dehydrogenase catalytic domain-containing protein [Terriglobia bacterium]
MRALRFEQPEKVSLGEFPDPVPLAGWARIRIRAAAICMTDLELLRGRHPVQYPLTPGHEYCGTVDRVGSRAHQEWVGRKVVADNEITCLRCRYCRRGEWRRCPEYRQIGFGPSGGYADYVLAPVHNLHALKDSISFEQGALLEPLGVALAVASMAEARLGSTATILGMGPIGLNCLAVLKASGARRILCLDLQPKRLALAQSWGACEVSNDVERLKALTRTLHPGGTDVVIEASGDASLVPLGVSLARFGGTLVLAGFCKHEMLPFAPDSVQGHNVRVLGAGNNSGFIEPAALAVGDGVLTTEVMITHRYRLEDFFRAFSDQALAAGDYIKGVFVL